MSDALPADLPPETVDAYRAYLAKPTLTSQLLIAKVRGYIERISEASHGEKRLDIGTAGELGAALLRLLREVEWQPEQLKHVQAATLYYIESDDSEPDLQSEEGFLDDAQVFNAVCRHIGKPEYSVLNP